MLIYQCNMNAHPRYTEIDSSLLGNGSRQTVVLVCVSMMRMREVAIITSRLCQIIIEHKSSSEGSQLLGVVPFLHCHVQII